MRQQRDTSSVVADQPVYSSLLLPSWVRLRARSQRNHRTMEDARGRSETTTCFVCRAPANLRCCGCRFIYYCSRDHQRLHWRLHKRQCPRNGGGYITIAGIQISGLVHAYHWGYCLDCLRVDPETATVNSFFCDTCRQGTICSDHENELVFCRLCRGTG